LCRYKFFLDEKLVHQKTKEREETKKKKKEAFCKQKRRKLKFRAIFCLTSDICGFLNTHTGGEKLLKLFRTLTFFLSHLRHNHLITHKNALWGKREDTRYGESSLPRLCHLCRLRVSDIEEDKEEDFLTTFVRHFREGIIERRR